MYYRYELWMGDEDMEVGFLQGLDDTCLPVAETDALLEPFDEIMPLLPRDVLSPGDRSISWFTEYGRDVFAEAIEAVVAAYAEDGAYDVVEREAEYLKDIVYEDDYQVVTRGCYGGGDQNLLDASWHLLGNESLD